MQNFSQCHDIINVLLLPSYNISLYENLRCKQQTCTWYLTSQRQSIEYIPFSKLHQQHLFLHQVPHQFHQLSADKKKSWLHQKNHSSRHGKVKLTKHLGLASGMTEFICITSRIFDSTVVAERSSLALICKMMFRCISITSFLITRSSNNYTSSYSFLKGPIFIWDFTNTSNLQDNYLMKNEIVTSITVIHHSVLEVSTGYNLAYVHNAIQ